MSRVACLLLLLAFTGTAAAEPITSVAVGPGGVAGPGAPHYLLVTISQPEAPHRSREPTDDCASQNRPATPEDGIQRALPPIGAGPPFVSSGTTAPYIPGCIAAPIAKCLGAMGLAFCLDTGAYASYDVHTGRYYIAIPLQVPAGAAGPKSTQDGPSTAITGTTGVSGEGDCETCPPPFRIG